MEKASVRELQHHLSDLLGRVDHGEEILITKRNRIIARLVPEKSKKGKVLWPNFVARAERVVKKAKGKSLSRVVREGRDSRG